MPKNPPNGIGKSVKKDPTDILIENIVDNMEKSFGKGAAQIPKPDTILSKVDHWASAGHFMIDSAIAGGMDIPGGIPFGRLTEISGKNASGKTSLLGHILASVQAQGGVAALIETEKSLDLAYLKALKVNLDHLVLVEADTCEDVFTRMEKLIDVIKKVDPNTMVCIGWDSLGGTPTKAQAAADADDKFYAEVAKVVGQNLQRLIQKISREKIALVFTNHVYYKMGVQFGDPLASYGGEKMHFFASLRLRLAQAGQVTESFNDDKQVIGHNIKVKVLKNKMSPVLRTVSVPCIGGHGFCMDYSAFEYGQKDGSIAGKGWKTWTASDGEEVKFQGWKGFVEKVVPHPKYPELIQSMIANYPK